VNVDDFFDRETGAKIKAPKKQLMCQRQPEVSFMTRAAPAGGGAVRLGE
jgi:hypothetical protein